LLIDNASSKDNADEAFLVRLTLNERYNPLPKVGYESITLFIFNPFNDRLLLIFLPNFEAKKWIFDFEYY
jgi:hypothetical protein